MIKIALYQFNPIIGNINYNAKKIIKSVLLAKKNNCNLFIAPELALSGYFPKDLLLVPDFVKLCNDQLSLFFEITGITIVIGLPILENGYLYNGVLIIENGSIIKTYNKQILPNYGVFDEKRYFQAGKDDYCVFSCKNLQIGILNCEDVWVKNDGNGVNPINALSLTKVDVLCVINASPYEIEKHTKRIEVIENHSSKLQIPIIYLNMVGGQDSLVFDGASFVCNGYNDLIQLPAFQEELLYLKYTNRFSLIDNHKYIYPEKIESVYLALTLAVKDYVEKNGFKKVILGLSGGIDSALTMTILVDALGSDAVFALIMPSQFTQKESISYSLEMLKTLKVDYSILSIEKIYNAYLQDLSNTFKNTKVDVTEENLQARIRGNILMAFANKFHYLVISTGNKSELATGYTTLYGDMVGGFALLKDLLKTQVYELSIWRNSKSLVIPKFIIDRAPTAELRYNQKDEDSLPPYDVLDKILIYFIEDNLSATEIIAKGFSENIVKTISSLLKNSEHKRNQGAIGPKISKRALFEDWRMPITSGYNF